MIERNILNELLRRGDVSPDSIRRAIRTVGENPEALASDDRLLALLEETGIALTRLGRLPSSDPHTATLPGTGYPSGREPASPSATTPAAGADSAFARRYEIIRILGRGGMGIVYLAYDRLLKREVAVKVIQDPDEKERRKFLREASAQARVSHENVCRVYDAGELNGQLFISMQYIPGRNLKLATDGLPLADKIRLIIQIAEGMSAAHRMGLVHRDIKPGNIMVEQTDDGLQARIVDFGLVRELTDAAQSQAGEIAGTPYYMAPEQVQSNTELIDWRTDVYALGITLFEILTGNHFFTGPTPITVMMKILNEEPRIPREAARNVPPDLQAIILKCIAKQPRDRYPSMRELADDLRRYLAGRPVLARPVPAPIRVFRWVRRNQVLTAVIAAGLILAGSLGVLWLSSVIQAREQAILARRFGEQVSSIERIHEISMMMPLHDIGHEKELIRQRMNWLRDEMARLGSIADGPGHYALGRGSMALAEWETARRHFETALRVNPADTASHFNLGLTLGMLYHLGRTEILHTLDTSLQEERLRKWRQEMGESALHHIRRGIASSGSTAEYGEALIALYEADYKQAIRLADIAWQKNPAHYQAGVIFARGYLDRAAEKLRTGDLDGAESDFESAGQVLVRLQDSARSSPVIRLLEAGRRMACISLAFKRGRLAGDLLPWAMEAVAELHQCDAEDVQAFYLEATLLSQAAAEADRQGKDPVPQLNTALAKMQQAIALKPEKAEYRYLAAKVWYDISYALLARGDINREAIGHSRELIQRALQLRPNFAQALNLQGMICRQQAFVAMLEGADQRPALREGLAALEQAHRLEPGYYEPCLNMAVILNDLTFYELNYGSDPRESARQALEWCDRAARQMPGNPYPVVLRAGILRALAIFALTIGGDGTAIRHYLAASREATEKNPNHYHAFMNYSHANELLACWLLQQGQNPAEAIGEGVEAGRKTVTMNPANPYSFHTLASIWLVDVDWRLKQNLDTGAALKEAQQNAERAFRIHPSDIEMTLLMAQVERRQAAARLARGQDPANSARAALERLAEADRMDPREPRVPLLQAQCWLILARGSTDTARQTEAATRAVSFFQETLRRNPFLQHEVEPALHEAEALRHPATPAASPAED